MTDDNAFKPENERESDKELEVAFGDSFSKLDQECDFEKHSMGHCGKDWRHLCEGHHFVCDDHADPKTGVCMFIVNGKPCGKPLVIINRKQV